MGTIRTYYKCNVCETVTLLRTQFGWLDEHPIRYTCGQCKITIEGTAFLDQENANFRIIIHNATLIEQDNVEPKFYIEASGELLTEKLIAYDPEQHKYMPPPFFRWLWEISDPNNRHVVYWKNEQFKRETLTFLNFIKNEWAKVRRINELWLNKNDDYLIKEVHKILPKKQFSMNNRLEMLRGVHFLTRAFFLPVITIKHEKLIFREFDILLKQNPSGLIELAKSFKDYFNIFERRILKVFEKFVATYRYLIPIYGLRYYHEINDDTYRNRGITTASFEDIKEFYIDTYEVAVELLWVLLAYNNLKYRNNFMSMSSEKPKYKFEEFFELSKGKKIEYFKGDEIFDQLIEPGALDNKIRNAIGHNTYEYDGIEQIIYYDPVGNYNPSDIRKMYLVQFAEKCTAIFQTLINLWELVYQTQKHFYLSQGMIPVSPSVFYKKLDSHEVKRKKNIRKKKRAKKRKKRKKKRNKR
mgnify:CR=1 FL=1